METLLVLPDAALADAAGTTVAAGPCTFAQSPVAGAAAGAGAAPTTTAAPSDASGYLAVACIGRMMLPLVPSCTTVLPASPAAFILALGDAASGAVTSYTLTVGAATSAAAVAEAVAILRHFTTMEAPPPGGVGGGTPPPRGHVLPAAGAAGGPPSAPPSAASSPGLAGRVERGSEVAARKILTLGETARHSIARRLAAATANAKAQQAPAGAPAGGRSGGAGGRGRREAPVPKAVVWTFSGVGRASSGVAGALTGVGQRVATAVGGGLAGSAPMRRAREAPPNSVGGVFHTALSTGCLAFANIYEVRAGAGGGVGRRVTRGRPRQRGRGRRACRNPVAAVFVFPARRGCAPCPRLQLLTTRCVHAALVVSR